MEKKKNKAAQVLVALGHAKMTPEQRKARAIKAAQTRWAKNKKFKSTSASSPDDCTIVMDKKPKNYLSIDKK